MVLEWRGGQFKCDLVGYLRVHKRTKSGVRCVNIPVKAVQDDERITVTNPENYGLWYVDSGLASFSLLLFETM